MFACAPEATEAYKKQKSFDETVFVFEMIRHAARSSNEDNVDSMEFFGVKKGHITMKGRSEAYKIGL